MAKRDIRFKAWVGEMEKDPDFKKWSGQYELPVRLGVHIAVMRQRSKMTQAELAKRLRVSQQMVAKWENAQDSLPNVRTLQKVAQAFGKSLYLGFR